MTSNPGQIPVRERRMIADLWGQFAPMCLLYNAPDVQRREMKRAFYAGVGGMMMLMVEDTDPASEITDLDMDYARALQDEIDAFVKDVTEGRA